MMYWYLVLVPEGVAGLAVRVIVLQNSYLKLSFLLCQFEFVVIPLVDKNAILMYSKMLIMKLVILVYKQNYENRNCVHNDKIVTM